jgi:hypothetical protein
VILVVALREAKPQGNLGKIAHATQLKTDIYHHHALKYASVVKSI